MGEQVKIFGLGLAICVMAISAVPVSAGSLVHLQQVDPAAAVPSATAAGSAHPSFADDRISAPCAVLSNVSILTQTPDAGNIASINQPAAGLLNSYASITQEGSQNVARITQTGGADLWASVVQNGAGNMATVIQSGFGNSSSITQSGSGNVALVVQR